MRRRFLISTLVCLLGFGAFFAARLNNARAAEADEDTGYSQIAVFARAVQLIRQAYVDGNKTSYQGLIYAALKGMLSSLDPHRQFLDPDHFKELQDAVNVLRGRPGQQATLTVMHPSTKEIKEYKLDRADIKVDSVKGVRMLDPDLSGQFKIGYVRLVQFNDPTADELSKALDELQKQGMQGLILDLRNNPGGLLNSAVDVCAQFLPPNT